MKDFLTEDGIVRITNRPVGALKMAYLYPGVYTSEEVERLARSSLANIQAIINNKSLLKEYASERAKLDEAVSRSKIQIVRPDGFFERCLLTYPLVPPGRHRWLCIEEILAGYRTDPAVMPLAERCYQLLVKIKDMEKRRLDIPYRIVLADANGPVERIGSTYAVGQDGTAYKLHGAAWIKEQRTM